MLFDTTVILEQVFDLTLCYFGAFPPRLDEKHTEFRNDSSILGS